MAWADTGPHVQFKWVWILHYKYALDAEEIPSAFSQDAVRAKQNLIRDNFKDQFLKSIKTSVNYLL